MAHFYTVLATVFTLTVIVQGIDIGELKNCDDCCSRVRPLPKLVKMGGTEYGAYSVCSNGYVHLLNDETSPIQRLNGVDYIPTPADQTTGSAFIAPFWQDVNLRCPAQNGEKGSVGYFVAGFDEFPLTILRSGLFTNSEVGMIVVYDNVQRFNCPNDRNTNTVIMVLVTGRVGAETRTHVQFIYESVEWFQSRLSQDPPTVGWGDGRNNGFSYDLQPDPVTYLTDNDVLNARIDEDGFPPPPQSQAKLNNWVFDDQVIKEQNEIKEQGVYEKGIKQMFLQKMKAKTQAGKYGGGSNKLGDKEKNAQLEKISKLFQAMLQQNIEVGK